MHTRGAKEELAILLPNTMSHALRNGRHVLPEPAAASRSLFDRLGTMIGRIVDLAMRRPVIEDLGTLSAQELADVGLTRAEMPSSFDPASDTRQQRAGAPDCLNWACVV